MASWVARLLFDGETLVDVGVDDSLASTAVEDGSVRASEDSRDVTSVMVSGYALSGRLRGYYDLGVGNFRFDPADGRFHGDAASLHHAEPATSLSPAQRQKVKDWLQRHSPEAWASSLEVFRRSLADDAAGSGYPDPGHNWSGRDRLVGATLPGTEQRADSGDRQ